MKSILIGIVILIVILILVLVLAITSEWIDYILFGAKNCAGEISAITDFRELN